MSVNFYQTTKHITSDNKYSVTNYCLNLKFLYFVMYHLVLHQVLTINSEFYTTTINTIYNYDIDLLKMSRVMLKTCTGF
jgi:hypothetical protein